MNSTLLVRKFIITLIFLSICKVASADSATLNNGGTTTNQQNIDEEGEFEESQKIFHDRGDLS